jgi:hypothetical protein
LTATRACTPRTTAVQRPAISTSVPPVDTIGQVKTLPPTGSPSGPAAFRKGQSYVWVAPAGQSLTTGIWATEKTARIRAYGA